MDQLRGRLEEALGGTYVFERELGGGGMSRTYLATEQALNRRVVVKVLAPELLAGISLERFHREVLLAAQLQHPQVVPVLTAGEAGTLPWFTMPYVEGDSLRRRLEQGPMPTGETISILRDVARALAYAHARGIVHRDIKPDNVLLSGGSAVVTDFGIAKAIAAAAEGPTGATLTQLGTAVGTPAYMAPEQAAGDPSTDHRADIYAFGCMAYEMVTGQPPFSGLTPHKLLAAHMSEMPAPLAQRRPDCPPALASLIMSCLVKDPEARLASAAELLHALDGVASTSAPQAALPAVLIGGRSMLLRALGIYAAAFIGVAIVARAAIVAIGLPDWVFPGALVVMALGLPAILFTAYTQFVAHRQAIATPTFTPGGTPTLAPGRGTMATLAIKASPHVSWKRTTRGGVIAVSVFAVLVAGYMILRALGIGPAGSLLASGKLTASDKVLVAAFDAPGADSSLGATIAEAVRTNLSQSRAMHIVPTSAVVAALEQMNRPDTARVDFATAREIAQRTGVKAVVGGSIVPAGAGYIVTARLVAAESGDELASYRESARDAGDLIPSVDRLTKSLRAKIGESLKAVRAAPPLSQVTTGSLGALRAYAAGLTANDIQGNYPAAVRYFQDAIRQDSSFAMAYVQLAYSLQTIGGAARNAQGDSALATAFRLRQRLPERERYNVEGAYYMAGTVDRPKAIEAFRRAVELDSTNDDAANSLGGVLADIGDGPGSERAYRVALTQSPTNGTILGNLAILYSQMGRRASFDSVMGVLAANKVPFPTAAMRFEELWTRRDYDAAERLARARLDSLGPSAVGSQNALVWVARLRGRLREAERRFPQAVEAGARFRGDTISPHSMAFVQAMMDGALRGDTARGLAVLDAVLRTAPVESLPLTRDGSMFVALAYSRLGAPAKARQVMARHEARLDPAARRGEWVFLARERGLIALAEGKTDSALAWFRRGDVEADGLPTNKCTPCTPVLVGLAFDRAGQADSARTYLARYADMPGAGRMMIDQYFLAPVLYRLGELYEGANDARHAEEYYGRFVDLWRNADPDLQPRVDEARKRLAELVKAKG